jgi:hypothetical protein
MPADYEDCYGEEDYHDENGMNEEEANIYYEDVDMVEGHGGWE